MIGCIQNGLIENRGNLNTCRQVTRPYWNLISKDLQTILWELPSRAFSSDREPQRLSDPASGCLKDRLSGLRIERFHRAQRA